MKANRTPTTMEVVVNGNTITRPISHYDVEARRFVPEVAPHEELVWFIGSITPTIVQVREPDREEDYEVCPICEYPSFVRRCARCGYEPA